jgi:hypothetical protein
MRGKRTSSTLSWASLAAAMFLLVLGQARAAMDMVLPSAPYIILHPTAPDGHSGAGRGTLHVERVCIAGSCTVAVEEQLFLSGVDHRHHVSVFYDPSRGHAAALATARPPAVHAVPGVLSRLEPLQTRHVAAAMLLMLVIVQGFRRADASAALATLKSGRPCVVEPDGLVVFRDGKEPGIGRSLPDWRRTAGEATAFPLSPPRPSRTSGAPYREAPPLPVFATLPGSTRAREDQERAAHADASAIQRVAAIVWAVYLLASLVTGLPLWAAST